MTTNQLLIEKLISETDEVSRKLRDNPHCKETATEYEKVKGQLKTSVVHMREALEAIKSSED